MAITIILWIFAVIFVLAGLAGFILPLLPGAPLLFVGLWLAARAEGFEYVGRVPLILIGIMAALTYVVDFLASAFGAKRFGASRRAIVGAAIGAVVGLFIGLTGIVIAPFIGPFIGAVIGELSAQRNIEEAGRAGIGATLGLVLGVAAKLTLGFAMLGVYIVARFI